MGPHVLLAYITCLYCRVQAFLQHDVSPTLPNKTRKDKTRRDETRQDKTRQKMGWRGYCLVLSRLVSSRLVLSCLVVSCFVLSGPALFCLVFCLVLVLSCLVDLKSRGTKPKFQWSFPSVWTDSLVVTMGEG